MYFKLLYLLHILIYWGTSIYLDDYYNNYKYIKHSIYGSFRNQILVTLPIFYVLSYDYPIEKYNFITILTIPILICLIDFWFYITHKFAHIFLWNIHKEHHTGKNFAVKSLDAHPIEHLICNLGSILFSIYLFKFFNIIINIYVIYLSIISITINTCVTHSEKYYKHGDHIVHHKKINYNFGTGFYFMDKIFKTYHQSKNS